MSITRLEQLQMHIDAGLSGTTSLTRKSKGFGILAAPPRRWEQSAQQEANSITF
jgi:hypothetical protein